MNYKTFFIAIILLISLGVIVSSTEMTFPDQNDITINIDLINGSSVWNESGTVVVPQDATLGVRVPGLASCDTIDTDASGVFSCGTDADSGAGTGVGKKGDNVYLYNDSDTMYGNESALNETYQDKYSAFTGVNWTSLWNNVVGALWGTANETKFTNENFTNQLSVNLSDISLYINTTSNASLYNLSVMLDNYLTAINFSDISLYVNETSNVSLYLIVGDTLTDTKICTWDEAGNEIDCDYTDIDTDTRATTEQIFGNFTNSSVINVTMCGDDICFNLTPCGDNEILKVDGNNWNCEEDVTGGTGTGGPNIWGADDTYVSLNLTNTGNVVNVNISGNLSIGEIMAGEASQLELYYNGSMFVFGVNASIIVFNNTGNATFFGGIRAEKLNSPSCDLKADTSGYFYCGTDADSGGSPSTTDYWNRENNMTDGNFSFDRINISILNITGMGYMEGSELATLNDLTGGNITITTIIEIRNDESATLNPGDPVHFTSYISGVSRQGVNYANNSDTSMHADCIVAETIGTNGLGQCVVAGEVTNADTSDFAFGDDLYLDTGGNLTSTRPSSAACVEKIGMVLRSHANNGVIWVLGAGRCNDVPNSINISGNITGDTGTFRLTDVGELVVNAITLQGNLTPYTHDLYNIGSSTNWINNMWAENIYTHNLNATRINATNISSDYINTNDVDTTNLSSNEMYMGTLIIKNDSQDLVIILG